MTSFTLLHQRLVYTETMKPCLDPNQDNYDTEVKELKRERNSHSAHVLAFYITPYKQQNQICFVSQTQRRSKISLNLTCWFLNKRPHHPIPSAIRAEGRERPPVTENHRDFGKRRMISLVEAALTSNIKVGWGRVAGSCTVGCNTFIFALVWLLTVLYLQSSCTQTRWNRQFRLWQI